MSGRQIAWAFVLGALPTLATYWTLGPLALLLGLLVAVAYLIGTSWRVRARRAQPPPSPPDPATLPPPTRQDMQRILDEGQWGGKRYRAESEWNREEQRAYLYLIRRDMDSQAFDVTVFDPTSVPSRLRSELTLMSGEYLFAWYPDHFGPTPKPVPGTYTVVWKARVKISDEPRFAMREVARDTFDIPGTYRSIKERAER